VCGLIGSVHRFRRSDRQQRLAITHSSKENGGTNEPEDI
jgi:hypothetical protein